MIAHRLKMIRNADQSKEAVPSGSPGDFEDNDGDEEF